MARIRDILQGKGQNVHTITPGASAGEAIEKMASRRIGALVVMDESGDVRGIVTERDVLNKIAAPGRAAASTRVSEIMTSPVDTVSPDASVEECMAIITERRHRHLPVMEGGRLVGLVSIGDLVKRLVDEKDIHIRDLTDYIVAKYPA